MGQTTSVREVEEPGLTRNKIMELSGVALNAYAVLKLGDKHRDPIPFTIIPPTKSVAEHNKLKNKPLPRKVIAEPVVPITVSQVVDTDDVKRRAQLTALMRQIAAETAWELGA